MNIKPKELSPKELSAIRGSVELRTLLPGVHQDFIALLKHILALEKINARANERIVKQNEQLEAARHFLRERFGDANSQHDPEGLRVLAILTAK